MDDPVEKIEPNILLVRQAQSGDLSAFEKIYHLEIGRVYALCLRMAADPHKAEQLAQETFVRVWQNLKSFREESAFSSWLHRIAVNVVLSDKRSGSRQRAKIQYTDDLSQYSRSHSLSDRGMDLEKCIAALPEKARMVLVLHDVEGYKHAEISDIMNIAPGTSKAHLHRARMLLRTMLGGGK